MWSLDLGARGMTGFGLAVIMAFAFAVTNGLHDAANAIATLIATRGARPLPAVLVAAVCNMIGPLLLGAAVANTIATIVQVPRPRRWRSSAPGSPERSRGTS